MPERSRLLVLTILSDAVEVPARRAEIFYPRPGVFRPAGQVASPDKPESGSLPKAGSGNPVQHASNAMLLANRSLTAAVW
jgi:hypothetical protein